jgi:hypothetical protein
MRERRAERRVGGPRARESCSWLGVSAHRPVVSSGATPLRRWVLHSGSFFSVAVPTPRILVLQRYSLQWFLILG